MIGQKDGTGTDWRDEIDKIRLLCSPLGLNPITLSCGNLILDSVRCTEYGEQMSRSI